MSQEQAQQQKVEPEDLTGFGRMAESHWRKHRPRLVKYLEQINELYQALQEAENQAEDYMEEAQKKGVDYHAAREVALATWIILPDIGEPSPE